MSLSQFVLTFFFNGFSYDLSFKEEDTFEMDGVER